MKKLAFCFVFVVVSLGHAFEVNRLNGSGSVTYIDFSIPGKLVSLELSRSYNSITARNRNTAWNGAFGWGWTSDFESFLRVTPERHVLLRDGGTGNTLLFKPQKDNPKAVTQFLEKFKKAYFEREKKRPLSKRDLDALKLPKKLATRLKNEPKYRLQMASRYKVKVEALSGETLVSSRYGYQTIQFRNNFWVRQRQGMVQYYDKEGRLVRQADRDGYYVDYKYNVGDQKMRVAEIQLQDRTATLKLTWNEDRVTKVVDNRGKESSYEYDGNKNLVRVINSRGEAYRYRYQNAKYSGLLTRIDYDSESQNSGKKIFRIIGYNADGLISRHRSREGAEVKYTYGRKPTNPQLNFWTRTTWVSGKPSIVTPDELYEEYTLRKRSDGSSYLYKMEAQRIFKTKSNKKATLGETVIFTECCSTPSQIVKNGEVTKFKYYGNGLLKQKSSPTTSLYLEYDLRWMKISRITKNGVTTRFKYSPKNGRLSSASSGKEFLFLRYDEDGRVKQFLNKKRKPLLTLAFGLFGKPTIINKKGLGELRIAYNKKTGRVNKMETYLPNAQRAPANQSERLENEIITAFQRYLNLIRPASQSPESFLE